MSHLLAVLGLGAACVVWFLLQRATGRSEAPPCGGAELSCDGCARHDTGCPAPEGPQSRPGSLFG
jgi:hypothetical protein